MRVRRSVFLVLAVLAILASLTVSGAGTGSGSRDCGDGHTLGWTPAILWPPNHKMDTIMISYVDSESDHELSLQVTGVTVVDSLKGDGNTTDDFAYPQQATTGTGSVSVPVLLRAERAGTGDGRVYQIAYEATSRTAGGAPDNDCGSQSQGPITVVVPHDCRQGACRGVSA